MWRLRLWLLPRRWRLLRRPLLWWCECQVETMICGDAGNGAAAEEPEMPAT